MTTPASDPTSTRDDAYLSARYEERPDPFFRSGWRIEQNPPHTGGCHEPELRWQWAEGCFGAII